MTIAFSSAALGGGLVLLGGVSGGLTSSAGLPWILAARVYSMLEGISGDGWG